MTCHNCQIACNRFGKHRNGLQRFRCSQCRKTFTEDHAQPLGEMRLPMDKATTVLQLLVEGIGRTEGRDCIARIYPALVDSKLLLCLRVVVERNSCGPCNRQQPYGISRRKT